MATGNMIHSRCRGIFAALALLSATMAGAADSFAIRADSIPDLILQDSFRPFVKKAAEDIAGDLERIFGKRPTIRVGAVRPVANAIVLARAGDGWENYVLETLPDNVLRITGSDDRGVMFGLYRFASDCLGVDPFYHWSGLEPERCESKTWDDISIRQGDPSFKFRAWFINDEDFLNGFRPEENGTRKIDYPRYHTCFGVSLADMIYETAVRAGFNTMICASYVDILNPDEKRLVDVASSRGLYVTMHHQEPVGRGRAAARHALPGNPRHDVCVASRPVAQGVEEVHRRMGEGAGCHLAARSPRPEGPAFLGGLQGPMEVT